MKVSPREQTREGEDSGLETDKTTNWECSYRWYCFLFTKLLHAVWNGVVNNFIRRTSKPIFKSAAYFVPAQGSDERVLLYCTGVFSATREPLDGTGVRSVQPSTRCRLLCMIALLIAAHTANSGSFPSTNTRSCLLPVQRKFKGRTGADSATQQLLLWVNNECMRRKERKKKRGELQNFITQWLNS